MSLASWGRDKSHVYVYESEGAGFIVISSIHPDFDKYFLTAADCADYLVELRDKHGHIVPQYAIDKARARESGYGL